MMLQLFLLKEMIIEFIFCYMGKDEAISLLKKDICKFDHKKWNILKLK